MPNDRINDKPEMTCKAAVMAQQHFPRGTEENQSIHEFWTRIVKAECGRKVQAGGVEAESSIAVWLVFVMSAVAVSRVQEQYCGLF
jgi:hypothetical protein